MIWIEFFLTALDEQAHRNTVKAEAIMELYERLKSNFIQLVHSQYAVPLMDRMFERPVFHPTHLKLQGTKNPARMTVFRWMRALVHAGILEVIREAKGSRPQLLALAELINLCEGKKVF